MKTEFVNIEHRKYYQLLIIIKNMSSIESRLTSIIVEKLGVEEYEVTPDASLADDLGADSLDAIEIISEIEKEFGITVPDDQAEQIKTVGDALAYVEANEGNDFLWNSLSGTSSDNESSSDDDYSDDNLTDDEELYLEEYKEILADYGVIGPRERRQLERSRVRYGISEYRAAEIEASIESGSTDLESDQQYLDEYRALKEDYGKIGNPQRKQLERLRERLGISESRAREIEQYDD